MYARIKSVLTTHTFQQTLITTGSTFLASGLGAVFYLLLARFLGPAEYGLFSLAMAALLIVTSIGDLGLGQSVIRFVGANSRDRKYLPYVNLALKTKLISGALAIMAFAGLSSLLAKYIFHQPSLSTLLPLVGIGVLAQLLFFLSLAVFQGLQKFWLWGGFQVGVNALRLLLLAPFIFIFHLTSFEALFVFIAVYLLGFILSLIWLDRGILKSKSTSSQASAFWTFNKWTAAMGVIMAISSRIDILLTARFLNLTQVGIYSLATTMVAFLPQLAGSIGAVTTAKFAGFTDAKSARKYLGKAILFVGGISVLVALVMIPVAMIVIRFAGKADYAAAITPFFILLLGLVVFLFTNPIRDSLLYYHAKPQFFFWLNLVQAITIFSIGWHLIPLWGVIGSAISYVISQVFVVLVTVWYYRKLTCQIQNI